MWHKKSSTRCVKNPLGKATGWLQKKGKANFKKAIYIFCANQVSRAFVSSSSLRGSHWFSSSPYPTHQTKYLKPRPERCSSIMSRIRNSLLLNSSIIGGGFENSQE